MPGKQSLSILPKQILDAARRRFGVDALRPGQAELIQYALSRQSSLGILPTGWGKSLCYQLPALFLEGVVVVVSPLIALMQDQQAHMAEARIDAARLDSTVPRGQLRDQQEALERGDYEVVLVTPERLTDPEQLEILKRRGVALFVVDEAHCVSVWGHDFRPAYLELRNAIARLGHPPVMALTATAPPDRIDDILGQLGIPDAHIVQGSIDRENLNFEVRRTVNREEKEQQLLSLLRDTDAPCIVYAATVRRVNELHAWLAGQGIEAARYHGQLRISERESAQERFMSGEQRFIVATNAFGLGVDKPDVRHVVHWNFPDSLDSYYQEAGRAGRDGEPARCVLFYRLEDRRLRRFFLAGKHPREHELRQVLQAVMHAESARIGELVTATGLNEKRVRVICAELESRHVIRRRGAARVAARRMDDEEIAAFIGAFESHFRADEDRLRSMMDYAETARCRVQFLREYFGEVPGEKCGRCDNCRRPVRVSEPVHEGASAHHVAPPDPAVLAHQAARPDQGTPRHQAAPAQNIPRRPHAAKSGTSRSSPSPTPADSPTFQLRQEVGHKRFGKGEVVGIVGDEIEVAFARYGRRRVLAAYLRQPG